MIVADSFVGYGSGVNPYEPPQSELPPPPPLKKRRLLLIWFLTVLGYVPALALGNVIPELALIATPGVSLLGGWQMARRLHQTPGMIAGMSLLYGLLIFVSVIAIFFAFCSVIFMTASFQR